MRVWRKITGPGEVARMISAAKASTGEATKSKARDTAISTRRLTTVPPNGERWEYPGQTKASGHCPADSSALKRPPESLSGCFESGDHEIANPIAPPNPRIPT